MTQVLIAIDIQNDYFPGGTFPLWRADDTLERVVAATERSRALGWPVIHVQHLADPALGVAPFFNRGTRGAEIHPRMRAAAPDAPVVEKSHADAFVGTRLESVLRELGASRLLVCGMMTQNCVTHTAISKAAERYDVAILSDACTTVSELLHLIALHAVSTRCRLMPSAEALALG